MSPKRRGRRISWKYHLNRGLVVKAGSYSSVFRPVSITAVRMLAQRLVKTTPLRELGTRANIGVTE